MGRTRLIFHYALKHHGLGTLDGFYVIGASRNRRYRLTRIETDMEQLRQDLTTMRQKIDSVVERL